MLKSRKKLANTPNIPIKLEKVKYLIYMKLQQEKGNEFLHGGDYVPNLLVPHSEQNFEASLR